MADSVAGVTDHNEIQCRFHGVHLNCGLGSDLVVIKAVVLHKAGFPIRYRNDCHCTLIDEAAGDLGDLSSYSFSSGTHKT